MKPFSFLPFSGYRRSVPGRSALRRTVSVMLALSAFLGACGGDDYQPEYDRDYAISGIGLDGPLTNAHVAIYPLLDNATRQVIYQTGQPGVPLAEGVTDDNANVEGVLLENAVNPPYVLEFSSTDQTIDLTTGAAPVIAVVRTVLTEDMLAARVPLYASPVTTMALEMALDAAGVGASADSFTEALAQSASRVKSTLGFGMDASLDIFTTPPVLGDEVDASDSAALQQVLFYRSAIESIRVLVQQLSDMVGAEGDLILDVLGQDLADGEIDGQVSGERASIYATDEVVTSALTLFAQPPSALCVVSDNESCLITVANLNAFLVAERDVIGLSSDEAPDIAPVTLDTPRLDIDSDDDGVNNDEDAFPDDAQESTDTDADGVGDNSDNCPAIANPGQGDIDSDGTGDACEGDIDNETDSDGDGVPDVSDNCLSIANTNQQNTDQDSQGNLCDSDDDNDGTSDANDAFPLNANEVADTDSDRAGDNGDNCPLTANANQLNTDGDEDGNACDLDDDNDSFNDEDDNCPITSNAGQEDLDLDLQGDVCDSDDDNDGLSDQQESTRGTLPDNPDSDGDGALDGDDNCPADFGEDFTDTDGDDYGDLCDTDDDGDTRLDEMDNCPLITNRNQLDTDLDGFGDVCDEDDDEDGVPDVDDLFPLNGLESSDSDGDNVGDNSDNCVDISNALQIDSDSDGAGNVCDDDDDNDGLLDEDERVFGSNPLLVDSDRDGIDDPYDNCIIRSNADQVDSDFDGIGDVCDTD